MRETSTYKKIKNDMINRWEWPCKKKMNNVIAAERCKMSINNNCKGCKFLDKGKSFSPCYNTYERNATPDYSKYDNENDDVCLFSYCSDKRRINCPSPIKMNDETSIKCKYRKIVNTRIKTALLILCNFHKE